MVTTSSFFMISQIMLAVGVNSFPKISVSIMMQLTLQPRIGQQVTREKL